MIASISGTVQKVGNNDLIVAIGGIGVRISAPRNVLEDAPAIGRPISLFTHLIVRETELSLYGFESEEDLRLFEILLGINGVGPKVALSILSTLSPDLLQSAVMHEEAAVLQRVPGIGKKTADRIMFALRDKLDLSSPLSMPLVSDVDTDVIEVLTGLGFSIVEAQTALQNIPRDVQDVETRVQLSLQYLDQGAS